MLKLFFFLGFPLLPVSIQLELSDAACSSLNGFLVEFEMSEPPAQYPLNLTDEIPYPGIKKDFVLFFFFKNLDCCFVNKKKKNCKNFYYFHFFFSVVFPEDRVTPYYCAASGNYFVLVDVEMTFEQAYNEANSSDVRK